MEDLHLRRTKILSAGQERRGVLPRRARVGIAGEAGAAVLVGVRVAAHVDVLTVPKGHAAAILIVRRVAPARVGDLGRPEPAVGVQRKDERRRRRAVHRLLVELTLRLWLPGGLQVAAKDVAPHAPDDAHRRRLAGAHPVKVRVGPA
eukprot:COSAG06_NODE_4492_length_4207_cov_249.023612_1_plen_146_part_10